MDTAIKVAFATTDMETVNQHFGSGTIQSAACGVSQKAWQMRSNNRSSRYTTCWMELPVVS